MILETTGLFEDISLETALSYKYIKQRSTLVASWPTCEGSTMRNHAAIASQLLPSHCLQPATYFLNHTSKSHSQQNKTPIIKSSALFHNQSVHSNFNFSTPTFPISPLSIFQPQIVVCLR